jgi:hypothetical protein
VRPVRRSSVRYVALIFLAGAVVGRLIELFADRFNGIAPQVSVYASVFVLAGAVIIGVLAWHTWYHLHRSKQRMNADWAVVLLATSKAGVMVGGVFCGGYLGFAAAFFGDSSPLGHNRMVNSLLASGASALLLVAALLLEWSLTLPSSDDDDKQASAA